MVVVTVQTPTSRRLAPADPTVLPAIQRHVLLVNELQRGHMLRAALRGAWLAAGGALAFRLGVDCAAFVFSTHGPAGPFSRAHESGTPAGCQPLGHGAVRSSANIARLIGWCIKRQPCAAVIVQPCGFQQQQPPRPNRNLLIVRPWTGAEVRPRLP